MPGSAAAPCRLPLDGGQAGATVRLRALRSGLVRALPGYFVRPTALTWPARLAGGLVPSPRAPVVSFAVEHPGFGLLLVDAGVHPDMARRLPARVVLDMAPEGTVRQQVEGEPRAILMTHLHVDHTAGLRDFPGAPLLVTGPEWASLNGPRPALRGYDRGHLRGHEVRLLDLAETDLFGDGSVRLLPTPGHTRGHVSLELRTADGPVLLCGDAIYNHENLHPGREPLVCEDRDAWRGSVQVVRDWLAEHPGAPAVPCHDAAAWAALPAQH